MIVPARINYTKALQVTGKKFLMIFLWTFLISYFVDHFHLQSLLIPDKYITLMSSALGIFLGFRINAAYSRWRDGYGLFRDIVAVCISILSQINLLSRAKNKQTDNLYKLRYSSAILLLQYAYLVRQELLRAHRIDWPAVLKSLTFNKKPLFEQVEIEIIVTKKRKGSYILHQFSALINQSHNNETPPMATGELAKSIQMLFLLEQHMVTLKHTPFPWGYQFYTRIFVWILPILFILSTFNELGIVHYLVISLISIIFITIEQVATNLDDPITSPFNGVPFNALCRMLEIELLEALDIKHDLKFLKPNKGVLL